MLKGFAKWYLSLLPSALPDYYEHRRPLQRATLEYEDEEKPLGFQAFFKENPTPLDFVGKRVLDFGCGFGGRTVRYKELGAASVTGFEVVPEMVEEAQSFAAFKGVEAKFLQAAGEHLPFPDESFDIICSYDVFEHVEDLTACFLECWRVLAPGGRLYAVFPPFYHPTGGSHLHGYISRSPFPNLLFSNAALMVAAEELMQERGQTYRPPALRPSDPLWGVNGATISSFEAILPKLQFSQAKVEYTPLLSPMRSRWHSWKMKYYAFPFRIATSIPVLNEIFTERIVVVMTK